MDKPIIIQELKERRTIFTKTFLMDDGSSTLTASRRPLHYKDETGKLRNYNLEIKDGKINKAIYDSEILRNNIGYSIVSKEDNSRIDVKLVRVGDKKDISYFTPEYDNNKALWEDVVPGLDIVIEFLPYRVKIWKILKNKNITKDIEFKIIKDDDGSLKVSENNIAFDSNKNKIKIQSKNIGEKKYKTSITNKKVTEYSVVHELDDKSISIDDKTRKRKFKKSKFPLVLVGDIIEYPLFVDPDINIPIEKQDQHGDNYKGTSNGITTFASFRTADSFLAYDHHYYVSASSQYSYLSWAWLYFDAVPIPSGSTVNSAKLDMWVNSDRTDRTSPLTLGVLAESRYNPPVPITYFPIPVTNVVGSVTLTDPPSGDHFLSIDVEPIVSNLVSKWDYSSGNSMLFYVKVGEETPTTATNNYQSIEIFGYGNANEYPSPELIINYFPDGSSSSSSFSSSSFSSSSSSKSSSSCPTGYDDDFTGTNGDPPNTGRWNICDQATGGSDPEIQNNQLQCNVWNGYRGLVSKFGIEGDFDIQVDFDDGSDLGGFWHYGLKVTTNVQTCDETTPYFAVFRSNAGTNRRVQIWYTRDTGFIGYINYDLFPGAIVGKLRITRTYQESSGIYLFSGYRDVGSGWEAISEDIDDSALKSIDRVRVGLPFYFQLDASPGMTHTLDNFQINSGDTLFCSYSSSSYSSSSSSISSSSKSNSSQSLSSVSNSSSSSSVSSSSVSSSSSSSSISSSSSSSSNSSSSSSSSVSSSSSSSSTSSSSSSISSSSLSSSSSSFSCILGYPINVDDDFTGNNGDQINQQKWNSTGSNTTPTIQNNKLYFNTLEGFYGTNARGRWYLEGDFDVQVDYEILQQGEYGSEFDIYLEARKIGGSFPTVCTISRNWVSNTHWYRGTCNGYTEVIRPDALGKLRLTRTSSTVRMYYWDIFTSSWTLLHSSGSFGSTSDVLITLGITQYVEGTLDNFIVNVGTPVCPESSSSSSSSSSISSESSSSQSRLAERFTFDGLDFINSDKSENSNSWWFEQGTNVHTSPTALQSGPNNWGDWSRLDFIPPFNGAGTLTFYWSTSGDSGDVLTFYINGIAQDDISGNIDWSFASHTIANNDVVFWVFENDFDFDYGTAWLDTFTFTPSGSISSSSESSVSSSSSSSTSLSSGKWTWGQQSEVTTDYILTFANGRVIPWQWQGVVSGSGDAEAIIVDDGEFAISEPAYTGDLYEQTNVKLDYNKYRGFRDDTKIGDILYRTASTRQGCLSAEYQQYPLDSSIGIVSLGWVQFSLNWNSSSSQSSSSSSSTSSNCNWVDYVDTLSPRNIGGEDFATWNASAGVWESVFSVKDSYFSGSQYGVAEYIYLVGLPQGDLGVPYNPYTPKYIRITHNRRITDPGQPLIRITDTQGNNAVFSSVISGEPIEMNFQKYIGVTYPYTRPMVYFEFYHTGATPMEISKIEFCSIASSSSSSVSSSSSSLSSSSSSVSSSSSSFSIGGTCTLNYFNQTYWQPDGSFASWNGVSWSSFANNLRIQPKTSTINWPPNLDPVSVDITVGSFSGTLDFDFEFYMSTGWSPETATGITLSVGDTYNFDLRGVGHTPTDLRANTDGSSFTITNIVFNVPCDQSSSSESSSSSSSVSSSSISSSSESSSSSSLSSSSLSSSSESSSSESTAPLDRRFDNSWWDSEWDPGFGTWDGSKWITGTFDYVIYLEPTTSAGSPNFGWEVGYDPEFVNIELDNITGASGSFQIDFNFDSGANVQQTGIALNNGQIHTLVLTGGGDTPDVFRVTNEAGAGNSFNITDIVFNSTSSSSSSRSGAGYTYFDNTYWTPDIGTWNASASRWDSTDYRILLRESGTWVEGFRPNFADFTFGSINGGSGPIEITLDLFPSDVVVTPTVSSGETYTMDLADYVSQDLDLYRIFFFDDRGSGNPLTVTNIVFWD